MKKRIPLKSSPEEIKKLIDSNPELKKAVRLLAIYKYSLGLSSRDVQDELLLLSYPTVCRLVKRFNQHGLEGLEDKKRPGKPKLLNKEQCKALKEIVLEKSPSDFDYPSGTWTGPILRDYILKMFNLSISRSAIYVVLKKEMGLSYQKGKGIFLEVDEGQRNEKIEFLKKKLQTESNENTTVVFLDEASLSNTATVSHSWSKRGKQPHIPQKQRHRERRTLFGCVEKSTGKVVDTVADKGNKYTFAAFLIKICREFKGKKVFVVLDNVRFHHAKRIKGILERNKHRIELVFLPPYSPDLNPIERIWWYMRKKVTHNRGLQTMNERIDAYHKFMEELRVPSDIGRNLCHLRVNII